MKNIRTRLNVYLFSDYLKECLVAERAIPFSDIDIEEKPHRVYAKFNVGDIAISISYLFVPLFEMGDYEDDDNYRKLMITFTGKRSVDSVQTFSKLDLGYNHAKTVMDTVAEVSRYIINDNKSRTAVIEFEAKGRGRVAVYERLSWEIEDNGYTDFSKGNQEKKEFIFVRDDFVAEYMKYKY